MKALTIVLAGFLLRVAIIVTNPIIFGGDTMIRLADRYTVMNGFQLPMLQILIAAVSRISMDPVQVRYLMAGIGAIAGLGFYWFVADLFGGKWAFPAALLFVTNPFVLAVSTVPFQEILMLAALFFAFHFFYAERWLVASLCLAAGCLTRYEAWAACPVLAVAYVLRKDRTAAGWLKAALLFGWMPVAWIIAHHGLASTGHFVIERSISIWRLQRYVYLGWITVKYTQITVLLLAAAGAWTVYRDRLWRDWRLLLQIAFVALFCVSVLFSAHGIMPDPERYVTSREAHILIYFVVLLSALGLRRTNEKWMRPIVAVSVVLGVAGALWYVRLETSKPENQLPYRLARFLDGAMRDNERALILAKPIAEETSQLYLKKAYQTGGEEGLRQARLELREASAEPLDYKWVRVYSRFSRDRLLLPPAPCGEWVAVWSDYPDAARELAVTPPVAVLRSGPLAVTVLRRNCRR